MVYHHLSVVVLATWNDVADVTAFHRVIPVEVHQAVGAVHVTLVIHHRRGCLVVHHQPHVLRVGIFVEGLDVEIGIGRLEVEHLLLHVSCPVFPTNVPALYQHLVEPVFGCEVDIFAHVGVVCRVSARGFGLGVVRFAQYHRGILLRIGPIAFARDHLPPNAHVLDGPYPRRVGILAGVVEVEYEVGGEHSACVVGYHHRAPRTAEGRVQVSLGTRCVGREPRGEHHLAVV